MPFSPGTRRAYIPRHNVGRESGVSRPAKIDTEEAFAFLGVIAPKLEQLRRRLVVANNHLKGDDADAARINAITESQLAIKEFMSGLSDLGQLVAPIDIVLEAVREEPPAPELPTEPEPAPEPIPEPAPEPATAQAPDPVQPIVKPKQEQQQSADAWLHIGTAVAIDRLVSAGMSQSSAEFHLEDVYANVGLKHPDGAPITEATIKEWRSKSGARQGSWRNAAFKRRAATKGGNAITDAKIRVNEMATTFLRMAQLARRQ
jgi:hypothetical protein